MRRYDGSDATPGARSSTLIDQDVQVLGIVAAAGIAEDHPVALDIHRSTPEFIVAAAWQSLQTSAGPATGFIGLVRGGTPRAVAGAEHDPFAVDFAVFGDALEVTGGLPTCGAQPIGLRIAIEFQYRQIAFHREQAGEDVAVIFPDVAAQDLLELPSTSNAPVKQRVSLANVVATFPIWRIRTAEHQCVFAVGGDLAAKLRIGWRDWDW